MITGQEGNEEIRQLNKAARMIMTGWMDGGKEGGRGGITEEKKI